MSVLGYVNHYYAAGVTSMLQSWLNFFFVAAEPGGAPGSTIPPRKPCSAAHSISATEPWNVSPVRSRTEPASSVCRPVGVCWPHRRPIVKRWR